MKTTWWMLVAALAAALVMTTGCDDGDDGGCEGGLTDCFGTCVNLQVDHDNCGSCGMACGADQTCVGGICQAGPTNEICNNVDDDQDGLVDEDLVRGCDNPCGAGTETCNAGAWGACTAPEPTTEVCDGADNDCDGQIDEDVQNTYYRDADEDTYGTPDDTTEACEAPEGYVEDNTDCNDESDASNPGITEEACDGVLDENCDGTVDEGCTCTLGTPQNCGEGGETGECEWGTQNCIDEGDGPVWGDCEGGVRPVAEICDGLDNDCDEEIDEGMAIDGYEANDDCASARGPFRVEEDAADAVELTGTLYSADPATQDEDWFQVHAIESTDLLCGVPWITAECAYYFNAQLAPPAGAEEDWELCLYVYEDDDCGGSELTMICSDIDDWDDTAGAYSFTVRWEGVCAGNDDILYRAVVRPVAGATIQDCNEYTATFALTFVDEDCTE